MVDWSVSLAAELLAGPSCWSIQMTGIGEKEPSDRGTVIAPRQSESPSLALVGWSIAVAVPVGVGQKVESAKAPHPCVRRVLFSPEGGDSRKFLCPQRGTVPINVTCRPSARVTPPIRLWPMASIRVACRPNRPVFLLVVSTIRTCTRSFEAAPFRRRQSPQFLAMEQISVERQFAKRMRPMPGTMIADAFARREMWQVP